MHYRVFTLHPDIFQSFLSTSLIARGLSKDIISFESINWREKYGLGNYRQVDDRPFGGGTGMVLRVEPVYKALSEHRAVSTLFEVPRQPLDHFRLEPNNELFWQHVEASKKTKQPIQSVTISLTPRGFPINQPIVEWLSDFKEINILCGRYEGFDARVSEMVDLELSLGDFVMNGGEVAAMALVEATSRLLPDFVTKSESIRHESFSLNPNYYPEQQEYTLGEKSSKQDKLSLSPKSPIVSSVPLFDSMDWRSKIMPRIEHPQYTRPETWENWRVPKKLLEGNHKLIQLWRNNWWQQN